MTADADDRQLMLTTACLLDQGRRIDGLSRSLTAAALIGLLLLPPTFGLPAGLTTATVAAVALVGLAETYLACRIGFDAALFAQLGAALGPPDTAGLDGALVRLGLIAAARTERPTGERALGARRLLLRQGLCLVAQAVLIAAGAAAAVIGARS